MAEDREEILAREALARGLVTQEALGRALRTRLDMRQAGRAAYLLPLLQANAPQGAQALAQLAAHVGAVPPAGGPPGSGYGARPGSSHGAPPGSGYGAPPGSGYGVPPGSGHGAPPGSGHGAPQAPVPSAPLAPQAPLAPLAPRAPPVIEETALSSHPPAVVRSAQPMLRRLGQYELVREIARGGVGAVYEAVQPALNRRVAIKVLLDASADPEQAERFKREGQAVVRLHHDNIVTVHDFAYEGKVAYLVMELVEGETLKERVVNAGALPVGVAVRYVVKLARAMAYAHSRGVIHRDLKPQNVIMAAATDEPRITDFGLARITDMETLTKTGAIMGTPAYMAPEQAKGERSKISERTDVYALGVILYELLTGKVPFRKKTVVGVMHQVLGEEPAPLSTLRQGIDPALEAICMACLVKDPEQRLGSALELAQELDDYARSWDTSQRFEALPRRGHSSLILALVIAALGLAAAVWVLISQR